MILKKLLFLIPLFTISTIWAQKEISGVVSDEIGPVPSVTVLIKNTTTGTETDMEGRYRIKAKENDILVFSYLGYETVEKKVGSATTLNISLTESNSILNEIVVVGYGKSAKEDLTGAIVKLKGTTINETVAPSVEQAFQGNASGVFVESSGAKLGSKVKINVRGTTSINAGTDPLYVIDGVPISASDFGASRGEIDSNPLNNINPSDIESIEILKDAASTAIYGSRGANGVVMITTKKGKEGKLKIGVNLLTGFAKPTRLRKFANAKEYTNTLIQKYGKKRASVYLDRLSNETWKDGKVDTDWQKLAFQTALSTTTGINFSGGTEKANFYAALTRNLKDGIYIGTKQKKINSLLSINTKVEEAIEANFKLSYSNNKINNVERDLNFDSPILLVFQAPVSLPYDESGNPIDYSKKSGRYSALIEQRNSFYYTITDNFFGNVDLKINLLDGLKLNTQFGYNKIIFDRERFQNNKTRKGSLVNGIKRESIVEQEVITPLAYLSYNKSFKNDNHNIEAVAGMETRYERSKNSRIVGNGFSVPGLTNISNAVVLDQSQTSSTRSKSFFRSFFGRLNYKLLNRYIIGLSARFDSSSKFGPNKKTGFFPSASFAWKISQEKFLRNSNFISYLKIRTGYGILGNSSIGNNLDKSLVRTSSYNGQQSYEFTQLGNPNLSWETTEQLDAGLEFGFLYNRINGEINYYNKKTNDLLFRRPINSSSGLSSVFQNIGDMSNTGFEASINADIIKNDNFSWNMGINFSKNKNKVISLPDGDIYTSRLNSVIEGQPIGIFYGAEFIGVNPENGNSLYRGPNNTKVENIADAEKKIIGDPNPDWIGAITNTLKYKGFDLSFMFQTVQGNDVHLAYDNLISGSGRHNVLKEVAQNAWTKENTKTNIPSVKSSQPTNNSRFVSDGSYIRLKNTTFGYNLHKDVVEEIGFDFVRLYFTGYNLLTITDYKGWDPEVNSSNGVNNFSIGRDFLTGPQEKSYSIGVKLGL